MIATETPVLTPDQVLRLPQDLKGIRWWLLWTSPQREKRLAQAVNDVEATPLIITNIKVTPRLNGAKRKFDSRTEVSLFPGYLFCNGTAEQIYDARRQNAAQVVEVRNQAITAEQICRAMRLSMVETNLTTEPLQPGTHVEVIKGPLTGFRGTVRADREGVVFFDIETLGRSIPHEIPSEWVEPV